MVDTDLNDATPGDVFSTRAGTPYTRAPATDVLELLTDSTQQGPHPGERMDEALDHILQFLSGAIPSV